MCGIFGFSGRFPVNHVAIRCLAHQNEARGVHSTGIFTVGTDKERTQSLVKDDVKASEFILKPEFTNAVIGANSIIGHTRLATWGMVSKTNSHPFKYSKDDFYKETVVGLHNGFIIEELSQWKKFGFQFPFDVDSMLIFAYLAKNGGDYNCLSQIEGAITIAFMVPDKFPDVIFLYRRTPRELHVGWAKEGIYFSSEQWPLKLIGCHSINVLQNNTLMMLKHGEVLDAVTLDAPKIDDIPFDAKRHNWKDKVARASLEQFEELTPKFIPTSSIPIRPHVRGSTPKKQTVGFVQKTDDDLTDVMVSLVRTVQEDVSLITKTIPSELMDHVAYENADFKSNVIILLLLNSADKAKGLPGFLVYDKENPENSGITMMNGVTGLKFRMADCGKPRTIIISDPVEGAEKFEYLYTPQMSRVSEVTLQLPFPQNKDNSSLDDRTEIDRLRKELDEAGRTQLNLLPAVAQRNGFVFAASKRDRSEVREPEESLHSRSEDGGLSGTEGAESLGGESRDVLKIVKTTRQNNAVDFPAIDPTDEEISGFLNFKWPEKSLQNIFETKDYKLLLTTLTETEFQSLVLIGSILMDAAKVKLGMMQRGVGSFSVPYYAMLLLSRMENRYLIHNSKEKRDLLYDNIGQFRTGQIKLFTAKKKRMPLGSNII